MSRREVPRRRPSPAPAPAVEPELSPAQKTALRAKTPRTFEDRALPRIVSQELDGWGRLRPGDRFEFDYGTHQVAVRWAESGKVIIHDHRRPDVIVQLSTRDLPPYAAVRAVVLWWERTREPLARRGWGTQGGHGGGSSFSFRVTPAPGGWDLSIGINSPSGRIRVPETGGVFVDAEHVELESTWSDAAGSLLRGLLPRS